MKRIGAAAVLGLALASAPGGALAQTTNTPCTMTDISASDGLSGSTPVADRPGSPVVVRTVLHNTTGTAFTNLNFILAVIPPTQTHSSTPSMAWRIDGGPWHGFGLTWQAPAGSGPDWQSPNVYVGDLAVGQTRTLELSATLSAGSETGQYQDNLAFSADPCAMQALALTELFFGYFTGAPAPPAHTTHPANTATGTAPKNSAPPAPPQSTAPSSPSPSPSPVMTSPAATSAASASQTPPPSGTPSAARPVSTPHIADVGSARSDKTTLPLTAALLASLAALALPCTLAVRSRLRRRADSG